jgi:hypothetical protein
VLVTANLEGGYPATSELVLAVIESILSRRTEPDVQAALAHGAIAFVPCASPDAAARPFTKPLRESHLNARPDDEDRDGRTDEDGPNDLDGDGEVLSLRVPDAEGAFVLDPRDERLLKPVEPSEERAARFRVLEKASTTTGTASRTRTGPAASTSRATSRTTSRSAAPVRRLSCERARVARPARLRPGAAGHRGGGHVRGRR